jgi:hypothetical protein
MRPGTRGWRTAVWLLLVANTPLIVTGLLIDSPAVETVATLLAVTAVGGAVAHIRAQKETTR